MKYYKVRETADNIRIYKNRKYHGILIGNELYTPAELRNLMNGATFIGCRDDEILFDPIEIKKTETYWSFGARFA